MALDALGLYLEMNTPLDTIAIVAPLRRSFPINSSCELAQPQIQPKPERILHHAHALALKFTGTTLPVHPLYTSAV